MKGANTYERNSCKQTRSQKQDVCWRTDQHRSDDSDSDCHVLYTAGILPSIGAFHFPDDDSCSHRCHDQDVYKRQGHIKILRDLDEDITGKNVLLVEDIIDSGRTLSKLRTLLIQRNPKKLKLCTLLDKPDRRVTEVPVDYVGFTIPDAFVVGYGLDYAQKYRNLDYVGVVHFEEE